jgi:hypothetical protein
MDKKHTILDFEFSAEPTKKDEPLPEDYLWTRELCCICGKGMLQHEWPLKEEKPING